MWDDIIEGECNGHNYYDSDVESSWGEDDSNCYGPTYESKKSKQAPMWKCKDGTMMKISDMTDKHLENAINYLYKTKGNYYSMTVLLENERKKRQKNKKMEEWESMSCNCQFCGHRMKVGNYHIIEEDFTHTEIRLICECGAMGPVIELHEYQCL